MIKISHLSFYLGILFLAAACSDSQDNSTANTSAGKTTQAHVLPKVLESYQVGEDVYVRSLASDEDNGHLWVGTSVGVLKIDSGTGELLQTFTRDDGLANEYVFAIGIDQLGTKWFGTNAGGVSRYNNGEWKTYFPMHGLADYWVYSFTRQKENTFWIGTWAGVNRVDLDTMEFTTYVKELINEWVYAMDVDSSDRVWFGTEGGVSMFDGTSWSHWTHEDGMGAANETNLPISSNTGLGTRDRKNLSVLAEGDETYNPNYVFSLYITAEDTVWVGTWGGGVARFDGRSWKNFTVKDGLSGNIVYSIEQSADGVLWFGTNHGLSRYDGKSWQTYDVHTGLLGSDVYTLEATPNNELWVGTKNGVARLGHASEKENSVH